MSNSFLAIWLAMALVRCQASIRSGRTKMRPSFCSRLYPMACTSLATVAENVVCLVGIELVRESDARCYSAVQQRALVILLLDHIQHLHQRVWAVPHSQSGQGDEMTPRQERKGLRTCTHTHNPHQMCTGRNLWCNSLPWASHWPNCDHKDRQG